MQLMVDKAYEVKRASTDLNLFIHTLRDTLMIDIGGYYQKEEEAITLKKTFLKQLPKGVRNIALVEQFLFSPNSSNSDRAVPLSNVIILEQKIQALYNQYIQIIESCWDDGGLKGTIFSNLKNKEESIQSIKKNLSLPTIKEYQLKAYNNNQTWADFNFKDKPLAAVLPILSQIQNDVRVSEYALVSFLNAQFSGCNLYYETFDVFAQSSKPSIRLGETYEAEIALGTYASEATFEVMVNGDTLNQVEGKAIYRVRPNKAGEQHYNATISYTNPETREITTFIRSFYFEVIP
jgi:hypothetical protein